MYDVCVHGLCASLNLVGSSHGDQWSYQQHYYAVHSKVIDDSKLDKPSDKPALRTLCRTSHSLEHDHFSNALSWSMTIFQMQLA